MPVTLEDLVKIDEEITWYDNLMTAEEFKQFKYEYDLFMQRIYGE